MKAEKRVERCRTSGCKKMHQGDSAIILIGEQTRGELVTQALRPARSLTAGENADQEGDRRKVRMKSAVR
jgi:hypothetical protein